jgi:2-haloacid dehalogenase
VGARQEAVCRGVARLKPRLFTFDIFGTVLDWRRGLSESVGRALSDEEFDRIIDHQGRAEVAHPTRRYARIVADSLADVLGLDAGRAAEIGAAAGTWPLFDDSVEAMRRLLTVAPCAAMTNSDRAHGEAVQSRLGRLSHWLCAEELGLYKPAPEVWRRTAAHIGVAFDKSWWHVSAYADYDLEVARSLGLTTVLITRPHHRPGPADHIFPSLTALATRVRQRD